MRTKKCLDCGKPIVSSSIRCKSCANKGALNPNWMDGKDKEKYDVVFNRQLRNSIRFRDRFTCQICGKKQVRGKFKLDIHHIDYNKMNNKASNLIALCHPCHLKTNYDREKWTEFFNNRSADGRKMF